VAVDVRPKQAGDSDWEILAVGKAAWLSGHKPLLTAEEYALVLAATSNDVLHSSWLTNKPKSEFTVLAVDGARIVGLGQLCTKTEANDYGLVEPMDVLPQYQGQHLGTRIWNELKTYSQQRGDKGLQVWALDDNDAAIAFYKGMGCTAVAKGEFWIDSFPHKPATGFQVDF